MERFERCQARRVAVVKPEEFVQRDHGKLTVEMNWLNAVYHGFA